VKLTYCIYEKTTGKITRIMSCFEDEVEGSLEDNEAALVKEGDITGKMVSEGVLTDIPEDQLVAEAIKKAWRELRLSRRRLLNNSDWTQVPDAPVDSAAWAVYRQQLRDLPANTTDPRNVVWPEPPS
jgi:hypothetical protein